MDQDLINLTQENGSGSEINLTQENGQSLGMMDAKKWIHLTQENGSISWSIILKFLTFFFTWDFDNKKSKGKSGLVLF